MPASTLGHLDARRTLACKGRHYTIFSLQALEDAGYGPISRLPYAIRILLENVLRHAKNGLATGDDVLNLASWQPNATSSSAIPFMPARVILQDFTGVPALVDLAALRAAMARQGGDPAAMNPFIPVDLVIDHSIQVDCNASAEAEACNIGKEMERNRERYLMLRWGQEAFANFRVVPPGAGIVHQVNLEYLASAVMCRSSQGEQLAYPDTVLGTDSHTTMINGMGVLGWGVGGIEAEAVLLGQPYSQQIPQVVGLRLEGTLQAGVTATDLVLYLTQFLRAQGVVGSFVEFFGPGMEALSLPDRATIANMAPEYGATMGFFPTDTETLRYLRLSGRDPEHIALVEQYCSTQLLLYRPDAPEPSYSRLFHFDLATVRPSFAGPKRPQDRLGRAQLTENFRANFPAAAAQTASSGPLPGHGAVVIAAITSCTNTSNPSVMLAAGLLAKKAHALGLQPKPWVKTSLAPGSRVVSRYLETSDLLPDLEALGFHVIGYGCTTCIGNSGPLDPAIAEQIRTDNLAVAAVLSGNRNFEARIHPLVQANYLCSPPMVVACALAGTVLINFDSEPLGQDAQGNLVYLRDIWPDDEEISTLVASALSPELFLQSYAHVFLGDNNWQGLGSGNDKLFQWQVDSTYIREPPFFMGMPPAPAPIRNISAARILAIFGDSITTDHISPAGSIAADSPAGRYLQAQGVAPADFNSYGSRRGNHEVMLRGTFANIRIRNQMVERSGGYTRLMPAGEEMSIFDAAMRYEAGGVPLVVLAGREYGTGSSRDWAAKGTRLLGVRVVIAISYERIHRSNLIGMGVLPLQFPEGADAASLGLDGSEVLDIFGLDGELRPGQEVQLQIRRSDGSTTSQPLILRLDNAMEIEYYRHGGILHKVLRERLQAGA
ncbi:MAG: aconitate hydratase AcnA [Desulfobulbaceae bacterium]|nr:aconitate hydratase AcnA [Desulfobulbaceae bacterium]